MQILFTTPMKRNYKERFSKDMNIVYVFSTGMALVVAMSSNNYFLALIVFLLVGVSSDISSYTELISCIYFFTAINLLFLG